MASRRLRGLPGFRLSKWMRSFAGEKDEADAIRAIPYYTLPDQLTYRTAPLRFTPAADSEAAQKNTALPTRSRWNHASPVETRPGASDGHEQRKRHQWQHGLHRRRPILLLHSISRQHVRTAEG
ncbi:unnamed protein product, partial [Tilletia laevis]